MTRTLRAPLLIVLVLMAAALAVLTQPALPAHAGESGQPTEGNYVALDQPKRLLDNASLTAQQVTYFRGMGGTTGIPQAGTSGLQLEVTLSTYTTVTSIYVVGKNMDQTPPNFPTSGSTLTAIDNKGPIMNSATVSVDDTLSDQQLAIWNIQGAAGTSVKVSVDVVGYYTRNNVGGGYVQLNQPILFDTHANGGAKIAAGATLTKKVTGGAVPNGATAVFLDLFEYGISATTQGSMVAVTYGSTITATTPPVLRIWTGATADSDLVAVKLNSDGQITFKNTGGVGAHLRARAVGYVTNSPDTGADWQPGLKFIGSPNIPAHGQTDVQITGYPLPYSGIAAANVHVKINDTAGPAYVVMYPKGAARDSTIDYATDPQYDNDTNAVDRRSGSIVAPGTGGNVTIENPSDYPVNVYFQVRGWFAGPTNYATAGGNSAMTVAKTAAGPCFAYLDPQNYSVWAGCTDDFGQTVQWTNLSPAGEQFAGQVQIVSRPGGRAVVVARHAPDGEVWTWEFLAGGAPLADPVHTGRYVKTPVLAFNLTNGNPVAFTSDALGKFWALDLNVTSPAAPVWTALANNGTAAAPTGELSATTTASGGNYLVATTSAGGVVYASYNGGTTLNWYSFGGTTAVGRVAITMTPGNLIAAVTRHSDGSLWSLGIGPWNKVNTTYHGVELVTTGSPSLVYNPATQLHGVLFRSQGNGLGDDQYVVWETAPETLDFTGPVYNIPLTTYGTITDAVPYDFRTEYDPADPTRKWGFSYLTAAWAREARIDPLLVP